MKHWLEVVSLSMVLLAAGCASVRDGTPDWVSGKSAEYPDTRYLVGHGQADNPEDARNRARADLAKIFETAVSVETSDVTSFTTAPEAGKGQTESQVTRNIVTRTEQIVRGIQIAELWRHPQTRTQHALAVLPRLQAAMGLRQEIEKLDAATRSYVQQARNAPDLLQQVAAAGHALETQIERDASQQTLRVIDVTGHGVEPEFNSGKLAVDLDALLKRVRMKPQIAPGTQPALEGLLSGALSAAGFVPDAGANAPYLLVGSMQLDDLGQVEGWYWVRGTLEVQLAETASGKVRGTQRWEIKTSSRDQATAQRRALDQADSILKKELKPAILKFATGSGSI